MTALTPIKQRRTKASFPHLVPIEQLKAVLLAHIEAEPRSIAQLSSLVGYSECAVRERMKELASEVRAYRICGLTPSRTRVWLWHPGAAPVAEEKDDKVGPGEFARQRIRKVYPLVGRRDDLVAALFGPAQGVAA